MGLAVGSRTRELMQLEREYWTSIDPSSVPAKAQKATLYGWTRCLRLQKQSTSLSFANRMFILCTLLSIDVTAKRSFSSLSEREKSNHEVQRLAPPGKICLCFTRYTVYPALNSLK